MFRDSVAWVLATVLLGCAADPGGEGGATTEGSTSSASETTATTATTTASTTDASTSTTATTTSTTTSSDDTTEGSEATTDGTTGEPSGNGCPAALPSAWIGCEDFDAIDDPASQIPEWMVYQDAFGVEPDGEDPSDRALRITLVPNQQFGGWVTLRFGDGPDGPGVFAPSERYDDVWIRYRLRTGDDWPGWAIGDVGELMVLDAPTWGIAAEMAIRSEDGQRLTPLGWSCIENGVNNCNGDNDWSGALQLIWNAEGETVLFDGAGAGQWRCFEAHMRLNTPGASDGEAQVYVDGNEEIAVADIDFLGTWTDYGLNGLRFTNFANPPAQPLDFWVDDIVFSTERVGCD